MERGAPPAAPGASWAARLAHGQSRKKLEAACAYLPDCLKQIEREDVAGRVAHIEFLNNGVKTRIADRRAGMNEEIGGVRAGCRIDLVQMPVRRSNVHEFSLRRRSEYEFRGVCNRGVDPSAA